MRRYSKRSLTKTGKPSYIAVAAVTLDGRIAAHEKELTDWTSKEDKEFLHSFLDTCDTVIVGRATYETARKPLSKRNCIVFTRSVEGITPVKKNLTYCNPERADLMRFIQESGYERIAVLGGTKTFTYFLENKLLDEFFLTIEPIIFGRGLPLFDGAPMRERFQILSVKKLNSDGALLIHATRRPHFE